MELRLVCIVIFNVIVDVWSYSYYMNQIPNGNRVLEPCSNDPWPGVGHKSKNGGGPRNSFGIDFARFRMWTPELCMADSDNDGLTNGQELGDPTCMWRPGGPPPQNPLSHPAFCNSCTQDGILQCSQSRNRTDLSPAQQAILDTYRIQLQQQQQQQQMQRQRLQRQQLLQQRQLQQQRLLQQQQLQSQGRQPTSVDRTIPVPGISPPGTMIGSTGFRTEAERLQFIREQERINQQLQQDLIQNPLRIRQEGQSPRFNLAVTDNLTTRSQAAPPQNQNVLSPQDSSPASAQSDLQQRLLEQQRILALQQKEILRLQSLQLKQQQQQQQTQQQPQQQIAKSQEQLMRQFQQNLQSQFNQPPQPSNQLTQTRPTGGRANIPSTPPAMPRLPSNLTNPNQNPNPRGQASTNNLPPPAVQTADQPGTFQCSGITNTDTGSWTLKIPKARVPNERDTYICSEYDFTIKGDFHMIAAEPMIDNAEVISSIKLFACDEDLAQQQITYPYYCNPLPKAKCRNLLSVSTKSDSGTCYPSNAGLKIGHSGHKRFIVQLHWVNPNRRQGLTDSSGLKLYYTNQMRQYDIGSKLIQYVGFNIPQSTPGHTVSTTCPSQCTSKQIKSPAVYVFQTLHQMNKYGRMEKLELLRGGRIVDFITNEDRYDYRNQKTYRYNPPKQILPGDELRLSCVYDTLSANTSIKSGAKNDDELCSAFVLYYPKLNWDSYSCEKYKDVDLCKLDVAQTKVLECDYMGLLNTLQFDSFSADMLSNCTKVCTCTPGCNTISNYAKNHPCFTGDFIEIHNYRLARNMGSSERLQDLLKSMDLCSNPESLARCKASG